MCIEYTVSVVGKIWCWCTLILSHSYSTNQTDLQYLVLVGSETESLQHWFPHDGGPANLPYDQQLICLYRGLAVSREVGLCRTHYPRGPLGGCQVRHCLEGVAFKCCLEVVAVGRKGFSSLLSYKFAQNLTSWLYNFTTSSTIIRL